MFDSFSKITAKSQQNNHEPEITKSLLENQSARLVFSSKKNARTVEA